MSRRLCGSVRTRSAIPVEDQAALQAALECNAAVAAEEVACSELNAARSSSECLAGSAREAARLSRIHAGNACLAYRSRQLRYKNMKAPCLAASQMVCLTWHSLNLFFRANRRGAKNSFLLCGIFIFLVYRSCRGAGVRLQPRTLRIDVPRGRLCCNKHLDTFTSAAVRASAQHAGKHFSHSCGTGEDADGLSSSALRRVPRESAPRCCPSPPIGYPL